MKFDPTITLAVVVSIATIISPVLTTLINNRFHLALKRLELQRHKITICEEYLASLGAYLAEGEFNLFSEYRQKLSIALIYADVFSSKLMLETNSYLTCREESLENLDKARNMIPKIAESLRKNCFKKRNLK